MINQVPPFLGDPKSLLNPSPKQIFSITPEGLFEDDFPIGFLGPSFFWGEGVHGIFHTPGNLRGLLNPPFQCHVSLQEIIWRPIMVLLRDYGVKIEKISKIR